MGDGEGLTVNFVGALIVGEFVAQETQEGDDPGIAGHAGGEVSFRKVGQAVLEDAPEGAGIGEGGGNFVREVALWFQAEVGRFLAGHVGGDDLVEQLRPEQTAFNSDAWKRARHYFSRRLGLVGDLAGTRPSAVVCRACKFARASRTASCSLRCSSFFGRTAVQ